MAKPTKKTKYVLHKADLPKVQDREYTYAEEVPVIDGYAFCDSDFACSYLQKQQGYRLVTQIEERELVFREVLGLGMGLPTTEVKIREKEEEGRPTKIEITEPGDERTEELREIYQEVKAYVLRDKRYQRKTKLVEYAQKIGLVNPEFYNKEDLVERLKEATGE